MAPAVHAGGDDGGDEDDRSESADDQADFDALVADAEMHENERALGGYGGGHDDSGSGKDNKPTCAHCGSTNLDSRLLSEYQVQCCYACRGARKADYIGIAKTRAKEEFLLTDAQLATLPFRVVPSKQRGHSSAKVFLTTQVRELALSVWNSAEAIAAERERRRGVNEERKATALRNRERERLAKTKSGNGVIADDIKRQRSLLRGETSVEDEGAAAGLAGASRTVKLAVERHEHRFETRVVQGALVSACAGCGMASEVEEL